MTNNKRIRLSKSSIGSEEKSAVLQVLDAGFLGMGKEVQFFEDELESFFGRSTACVANGTSALQLALEGCDIGAGDEVLVQSLTYVASFQAISATGATPTACDVSVDTLTMDIEDAQRRITEKTKAIMPVHYGGGVGDLEGMYKLAQKHNLRVIEDAAHAFGSTYKGCRIGGFGDIACFSFDGIKNITSGEGGCVVTNDKKVMQRVRDARLLGVINDSAARFNGGRSWAFNVEHQGWRFHMSNIMAAIGRTQLKKFDEELAQSRRKVAGWYDDCLKNSKYFRVMNHNYEEVVPHIYPIQLSDGIDRDGARKYLLDNGIETGVHYQPNHELDFYKKETIIPLRNTDMIYRRLMTVPLHPEIEHKDVEFICNKINDYANSQIG